MATWRCPHCRTVQLDGPRCFLCNRSATSCGTCVNFRRSVVGGVGYCALDRQRQPLTGEEQRACWSDAAQPSSEGLFVTLNGAPIERPKPRRTRLVELEPAPPISGS
jgi:hypothetical protein